ncbi:nck-associated protein 5-like [Cuculus canorus]|uniref:nck-associated protein 5-like n=1 Tax=Cuculus canorus TaxID=55661 RepID=UPI0023AB502A|nr:nck-associated protein 5-like [Cuculus canorus]
MPPVSSLQGFPVPPVSPLPGCPRCCLSGDARCPRCPLSRGRGRGSLPAPPRSRRGRRSRGRRRLPTIARPGRAGLEPPPGPGPGPSRAGRAGATGQGRGWGPSERGRGGPGCPGPGRLGGQWPGASGDPGRTHVPPQPTMSESAAEAPGDGNAAALGETGTSQELLQRLRELEAENSALAQANENQRETYERCLDEVANHVVQALLNQKDLREECIKLKKRVFDLERQNQALSDLFQQKLQLSAGSVPQLLLHPVPVPVPVDAPVSSVPGCAEQPPPQPPPSRCVPPPEVGTSVTPQLCLRCPTPQMWGDPPGALEQPWAQPRRPPPPLDALSPFFKKKAQILEVLRKLEETDALLGPPPGSPGSPEPCAAPGWPPWALRGAGGCRGAEGSPCSSPEDAAPPRGALLSALAERLLLRGDGGCCRRNGEAPGGPPRPRHAEHPAFLGLYAPTEENPEGGGFPSLSPALGGSNSLGPPPKVLKLPPPPGALRLSPQLARTSKIPCRGGGNPEASPALSRRASPDTPPEPPAFPTPCACEAAEQPPNPPGPPPARGERAAALPPNTRCGTGGSAPSRRPGKKPPEPGYLPFKERLAALGKLRGAEGREPPGPGRPERSHGAEPRPAASRGGLGGSLKHPEPAHGAEPLARCYSSGSMGEPGKLGGKGRPSGGKTPPRAPPAPPAKAARSPHGSPTKLPTKAGAGKAAAPRAEEPGGAKAVGVPRKSLAASEPSGTGPPAGAAAHSAIEEKVMKGIEENVLRLQGQAPGGEAKGKAAGGLASWFGLRRSKLPALSRRGDGGRGREWAGTPSPLRREVKLAARKLEAESLNISKLMEKAEDLRKALREEHAFLQGLALEKGRPRGTPNAPGHVPVMYQEVTAETFMQQLLDRVDGKDVPYENRLEHKRELCDLRRVPPDAKDPRLCHPPRNGIVGHLQGPPDKVPDVGLRDELPSDESFSESGTSQLFAAACGSLTRTLDSGIGTFPPPDYGGVPTKSTPKPRGRPEPLAGAVPTRPPAITKVPRKARTLEREVPSSEELLVTGKHRSTPACHVPAPPSTHGHRAAPQDADDDAGKPWRVQQSKNWTFPNAKACGAADPFLCPRGDLEGLHRPAMVPVCSPSGCRGASPEAPPPLPPTLSASSSRTPSASDVGDEGSTEAQSRDGGHGPPGLEHSESLSDSLYDSLSSCGSQG